MQENFRVTIEDISEWVQDDTSGPISAQEKLELVREQIILGLRSRLSELDNQRQLALDSLKRLGVSPEASIEAGDSHRYLSPQQIISLGEQLGLNSRDVSYINNRFRSLWNSSVLAMLCREGLFDQEGAVSFARLREIRRRGIHLRGVGDKYGSVIDRLIEGAYEEA